MTTKMQITVNDVEKVRGWFKNRGGVIRWTNLEIGASRPDQITPVLTMDKDGQLVDALAYGKPHWSMGQPRPIQPEEIEVVDRHEVPVPKSLFKPCEKCQGSGRRSVRELAEVRHESLEECLAKMTEHDCPPYQTCDKVHVTGLDLENLQFDCTYCGGTGCTDRRILYSQVTRKYWGMTLRSDQKAERALRILRKELGRKDVFYDWVYVGSGRAQLHFYTEVVTPFTLEDRS